jgi:hypothetical protein
LVIRSDRVFTSTSPHELGHCLNLLHTHETARGVEAINGSNCSTAGDLVCDTPADPRLGTNNVNGNCEYFGGNGFNPLTNNIMSYSRDLCRDEFTNGQSYRMRYAIQNEPILQNVVSNSCTTISEVNNICYPQTKTISLTNVGGAITSWASSNNIHIVSSNNTSAEIRGLNSSSIGNGWIRATLSNGITLQEDFGVNGKEDSKKLSVLVKRYNSYSIDVIITGGSGNTPYKVYLNNNYKLTTSQRRFSIGYSQNSGRIEIRNLNYCKDGQDRAYYTGYFGGGSYWWSRRQ